LWSLQNHCYSVLEKVYPQMGEKGESEWVGEFEQLAALLRLKLTNSGTG
jgi:Fe-S oxidoreductase